MSHNSWVIVCLLETICYCVLYLAWGPVLGQLNVFLLVLVLVLAVCKVKTKDKLRKNIYF